MTRLLVTGGSSYLGQHLVPLAALDYDTQYTVYQNDPQFHGAQGCRLDVRDGTAVTELVSRLQPDVIIHTAGSNRAEDMVAVIERGTANVAVAAQAVGARLIHISTDVVFDGRDGPYAENRAPRPLHTYGRAKAVAESHAAICANQVIVRTSLIYGLAAMDRGTAWIVSALRQGQQVTLFTDQLRNPVEVEALCRACLELAEHSYTGILHVAGDQAVSRAEYGIRMLDWWGIEERDTLRFGPSDPEKWPADCRLDLSRAKGLLQTPLPGIDAVLAAAHQTADF